MGPSLQDGQTVTIETRDGTQSRTFEFDNDNIVTFGNVRVPFTSADLTATIAQTLTAKIGEAEFGVTASSLGDRVRLTGEGTIRFAAGFDGISLNTGASMRWLVDGATLRDGATVDNTCRGNRR